MADLTLPVSRDARIIPDVLVLDRRDPELGAVVEYPDGGRRLDWIRVLVPEDLRRRRTLRLAVQYYRVAHVHVDHLLRRDAKFWRRYGNTNQSFLSNCYHLCADALAELRANREQIEEYRTWLCAKSKVERVRVWSDQRIGTDCASIDHPRIERCKRRWNGVWKKPRQRRQSWRCIIRRKRH